MSVCVVFCCTVRGDWDFRFSLPTYTVAFVHMIVKPLNMVNLWACTSDAAVQPAQRLGPDVAKLNVQPVRTPSYR